MRPVRPGDRGPAVEDIQRRLLVLGYELGPTGIDGVFLGQTREAVETFQAQRGLEEDGLVGDETWSALVDATFTLGDRVLYLRLPHFHGADVLTLQRALNALGFACGAEDGIFGAFTERAVREFQANAGLGVDGIVGDDTARAVENLRHSWQDKATGAHSAAQTSPARSCEGLTRREVVLSASDPRGVEVAERVLNLALANTATARVRVADASLEGDFPEADLVVRIVGAPGAAPAASAVHLRAADDHASAELIGSLSAFSQQRRETIVDVSVADADDEHSAQRMAVLLLDGICAVLD